MDHGLDRKDEAEIRERARKILEARFRVNYGKQRKSLTMKQLAETLGDECGVSTTSRREDERQRRKGG